jgi:signal transduction histidine kinase
MSDCTRILVAESDIPEAEGLRSLLQKQGYSVQIARNGKEGLCRVREFDPSLIISAVQMPIMDGYELCRTVRSDSPIPFVFVTSLSETAAVIRGLECGADHFITRPYEEEYLLACIDGLLRLSPRQLKPPENEGTEIWHGGERYVINSERQRILEFLLSPYETAIKRNTELSRAQNELKNLIEETTAALRAEVAERKLAESQLRQSEKMEAIGRLAGGIAHDFNNLLTVIQGRAQLLYDRVTDEEVRQELDLIRKTGARASRLTHQLLAFSRQQALQVSSIDLASIVSDAEKLLARIIGKNVNLTIRLDANLGVVKADAGQMDQILLNLVVNARDAMPNGGTILIETANVEFDERHPRSGRYVMLAVTDTGVGMDEATKSRVFEPFFTTKEKDKGTGIGLSTVHGIVHQCGGHIWMQSEPGIGTTFKIYLPRIDEPAEKIELTERRPVLGSGTAIARSTAQ